MSKHTPGPWKVHRIHQDPAEISSFVCVSDPSTTFGCRPVAQIEIIGIDQVRAEANARLIAAAPDLYDELRCALDTIHEHCNPSKFSPYVAEGIEKTIGRIQRALKKAEGAQ